MNKFFLGLACVVAMLVFSNTADASILSSLLTFDGPEHTGTAGAFQGGGEDKLQDDSLSQWVKGANNIGAGFEVGDMIWGIMTLSDIHASGRDSVAVGANPPGQVAFVFSAKIAGMTSGSGGSFALAPIANAGNAYDLRNLLHSSVTSGLSNNSLMVGLSSYNDPADDSGLDPLNWSTTQVDDADGFRTTNGWSWELTADLVPGTDDFFDFSGNAQGGGTDRGALTISSQAFSVTEWLDVDVLDFANEVHKGDITLDVGTVTPASESQQERGWTFTDQSTFYVNPVPEPASVITWACLAVIGAAFGARRRRKS